jgi:hypothetical protein
MTLDSVLSFVWTFVEIESCVRWRFVLRAFAPRSRPRTTPHSIHHRFVTSGTAAHIATSFCLLVRRVRSRRGADVLPSLSLGQSHVADLVKHHAAVLFAMTPSAACCDVLRRLGVDREAARLAEHVVSSMSPSAELTHTLQFALLLCVALTPPRRSTEFDATVGPCLHTFLSSTTPGALAGIEEDLGYLWHNMRSFINVACTSVSPIARVFGLRIVTA